MAIIGIFHAKRNNVNAPGALILENKGGTIMKRHTVAVLVLVLTLVLITPLWATGDKESQASGVEKGMVVSYNTPDQWANWGAVLRAFNQQTGITAPSDPKNSGQTMAALEAEAKAPQADTAYFGIVFGIEAARKNLLASYKPNYFDDIPAKTLITQADVSMDKLRFG